MTRRVAMAGEMWRAGRGVKRRVGRRTDREEVPDPRTHRRTQNRMQHDHGRSQRPRFICVCVRLWFAFSNGYGVAQYAMAHRLGECVRGRDVDLDPPNSSFSSVMIAPRSNRDIFSWGSTRMSRSLSSVSSPCTTEPNTRGFLARWAATTWRMAVRCWASSSDGRMPGTLVPTSRLYQIADLEYRVRQCGMDAVSTGVRASVAAA